MSKLNIVLLTSTNFVQYKVIEPQTFKQYFFRKNPNELVSSVQNNEKALKHKSIMALLGKDEFIILPFENNDVCIATSTEKLFELIRSQYDNADQIINSIDLAILESEAPKKPVTKQQDTTSETKADIVKLKAKKKAKVAADIPTTDEPVDIEHEEYDDALAA